MSETTLAHDTTEEPTHGTHDYTLSTHLETYRFAEGVKCGPETVEIALSETAHFYGKDAIIGSLVRHFGLTFESDTETTILFTREASQ